MGRWDGAGGASHSGCVGSVGGMGKGGSCGGGCGTSTGWKFPLKSFWLRSHFGSRKLHATKVFGCWVA